MVFNSFQFLLFFIVVTTLYYVVNLKWQWLFLLLASCYFYAFFIPVYLLVLFAIIAIDYFAGIFIEKADGKKRKFFLAISLATNLGVLATFKYYNFFIDTLNSFLGIWHLTITPFPFWHILLPIGLSFHTFQAMSYTIEVYKGNQKPEKHVGIYALYVMFYPQLVAGPIERPQQMLHQFYERHLPDYEGIGNGLKTILWGFFMKVVVADRLAIYVDYVYTNVEIHGRLALITASFLYSFQIYGDFAGYSLIAIGAARTMGFNLSANFKQPFLADSLANFWGRWHITLSQWFRDYVYITLGGNRVSRTKYIFNIFIVFIISGLWHGANWTFLVWGLLHGIFMVLEYLLMNKFKKKKNSTHWVGYVYTFAIVTLCFIFFRASNVAEGFYVIKRIFFGGIPWLVGKDFDERTLLVYSAIGIVCVLVADIKREYFSKKKLLFYHNNTVVRMLSCVLLALVILLFGVFDGGQFIYFQF